MSGYDDALKQFDWLSRVTGDAHLGAGRGVLDEFERAQVIVDQAYLPGGKDRGVLARLEADQIRAAREAAGATGAMAAFDEFERIRAGLVAPRSALEFFEASTLGSIEETVRAGYAGTAVAAHLPSADYLRDVIGHLGSPWCRPDALETSIAGLVSIAALAATIRCDPFSDATRDPLRELMGHWSHSDVPYEVTDSDTALRLQFYAAQGLDGRLLAIPDPGFTEALNRTGVLLGELFTPDFVEAEPAEAEEPEAFFYRSRRDRAYAMFYHLERVLRDFLSGRLEERCGSQWYKRRLPVGMLDDWKQRHERALLDGERDQPLIEFADFGDYIKIIARSDNWRECFGETFRRKQEIEVVFDRLLRVRRPLMHCRAIVEADFLVLAVESHRLLRAMRKLRDG